MKLSQKTLRDGSLCIRTAQRRSANKIVECLVGCDDYRKKFTSYRTTEEWLDALFDEAERDDYRRLCVVLNQEQVVGILELVQDHPDEITIALLAIASVHRVRGYGRRVVKLIAGAAADSGTSHLAIGVEQRNLSATSFWEALGFATTSVLGSKQERLVNMSAPTSALR